MLTNARSDRVRSLHGLSRRAVRERTGRFLAEGPQAVREALAAHQRRPDGGVVFEVLAVSGDDRTDVVDDLAAAAAGAGVRVTEVSADVMAAVSDTVHPQGVVAICGLIDQSLTAVCDALTSRSFVAVLARVRDPGNAGTVLRAADAAGAGAVLLSEDSVDIHNSKCVRSSAGSLFHLPVSSGQSLPEVVAALRARGLTILAADSRRDAVDLDDLVDQAGAGAGPLLAPTAWVFGNEAWGLTADDLALADHVVRVPIHGSAESLNLAVAAALCLYASARAHRVT